MDVREYPGIETEPADYTRRSARPLARVMAAVEESAQAEGFRVLAKHDLAAAMAKAGIEREPYFVVELCNARIASAVLAADPRIGGLLPCRIAVYQEGEQTVVSMVLPSKLIGLFPGAEVSEHAATVDAAMRAIIDASMGPE